jgi:hypothetical protein
MRKFRSRKLYNKRKTGRKDKSRKVKSSRKSNSRKVKRGGGRKKFGCLSSKTLNGKYVGVECSTINASLTDEGLNCYNNLQDNYYPTIGLDANKCQIYYNTIDLSQFTPEAQQLLEQERTLKIEINNITNDINYINKNYGPENLQGLNKELNELDAIIKQNPGNKYANDNSIKIKGFIDDINNKRSILPQLESELPQLQLQLKQLQLQIEQLKQQQSQI